MKMSVFIAAYNGAPYIGEQLASILDQTLPVGEIILVDDCSSDQTIRAAEDFLFARGAGLTEASSLHPAPGRCLPGRAVKRFRLPAGQDAILVLNKENLGVDSNFITGLKEYPAGDVILLSDQDDIWEANKAEAVCAAFSGREDILLLQHKMALIDETGNAIEGSDFPGYMLGKSNTYSLAKVATTKKRPFGNASGCCCAIRRGLLDFVSAGRQFKDIYYDFLISAAATAIGGNFVLDASLTRHRLHPENYSFAKGDTVAKGLKRGRDSSAGHCEKRLGLLLSEQALMGYLLGEVMPAGQTTQTAYAAWLAKRSDIFAKRIEYLQNENLFGLLSLARRLPWYGDAGVWLGDVYYTASSLLRR
ncbi:MAG: glycosyltransferase [Clostridiales Family XIII bacterium]|jgi:glycosyltransferase involved in cell wall biosynthesis|nr:glycosyltransferase [Clostridiales Family XIII bacterium]